MDLIPRPKCPTCQRDCYGRTAIYEEPEHQWVCVKHGVVRALTGDEEALWRLGGSSPWECPRDSWKDLSWKDL